MEYGDSKKTEALSGILGLTSMLLTTSALVVEILNKLPFIMYLILSIHYISFLLLNLSEIRDIAILLHIRDNFIKYNKMDSIIEQIFYNSYVVIILPVLLSMAIASLHR